MIYRFPHPLLSFGYGHQPEGERTLVLGFYNGFPEPSPLEPLLEVKVGSMLGLLLGILHAL
jgi:hypothetical protein